MATRDGGQQIGAPRPRRARIAMTRALIAAPAMIGSFLLLLVLMS